MAIFAIYLVFIHRNSVSLASSVKTAIIIVYSDCVFEDREKILTI